MHPAFDENELRRRADKLMRFVPEDGSTIGNGALRRQLSAEDAFWGNEENYLRVRDYLVERGDLVLGPGQGGTVRRARPVEQPVDGDLERRAEELLRFVPEDGSNISNGALQHQLAGLDPAFWGIQENYRRVRDYLVERGDLVLGPGYGGTVRRARPVEQPVDGDLERRAEELMRFVPEDGSPIGNGALHNQLGAQDAFWEPKENYLRVRDYLVERGDLVLGPGYGGTVRRARPAEQPVDGDLERRAEELMRFVPEDGTPIGNGALRNQLGAQDAFWGTEENYRRVMDYLVERDDLEFDPDDGDTVRRTIKSMSLEPWAQKLLECVPEDGSPIGNTALLRTLRDQGEPFWGRDEHYWAVRNYLVDQGKLELGRGKGGSVKRVLDQNEEPAEAAVQPPPVAERELYAPLRETFRSQWCKDRNYDDAEAVITAYQGKKRTGVWSRPDITILGMKCYKNIARADVEYITVEVKTPQNISTAALYEALAHRRAANRSYLLICGRHEPKSQELEELVETARMIGVGLILADDARDYDTWDTVLEAPRHDPDPAWLDEFVATQLPDEIRHKIRHFFENCFGKLLSSAGRA